MRRFIARTKGHRVRSMILSNKVWRERDLKILCRDLELAVILVQHLVEVARSRRHLKEPRSHYKLLYSPVATFPMESW